MNRSDSIKNIAVALCKFQSEVKNPSNNATNPMYKSKYSTLDNIINTVKPALSANGLTYIQSTSTSEDGLHIGVSTLLMHESGEWIESDTLSLPAYKLGRDSVKVYDAQAAGIACTYGRRYSLSAVLGISSEDDDDANGIVHETGSKQNNQSSRKLSEKQVQRFFAIAKQKNVKGEDITKALKHYYSTHKVEDLTKQQYDEAVERMQKAKTKQTLPNPDDPTMKQMVENDFLK